MRINFICGVVAAVVYLCLHGYAAERQSAPDNVAGPPVPRFSLVCMDRSVSPGTDFYQYANGTWVKNNPVPPDKSRWGAFFELQERNWFFIHQILNEAAAGKHAANSPAQKVADFFRSAMDTNRLEQLAFKPIEPQLKEIENIADAEQLLRLLAGFHREGVGAFFSCSAPPDAKNSKLYALSLSQGGLGLPDRDYYLSDRFAAQLEAYQVHIARMFVLLGTPQPEAQANAATVVQIETALAKASKSRTALRDPVANYHKFPVSDVLRDFGSVPFSAYLGESELGKVQEVIICQPEFFQALYQMAQERSLADWKVYLKWHVLRTAAPYLHQAAEAEYFAFNNRILRDQQEQEPRWQRAARVIDAEIGEALGQLFVEKHFPPAARQRMTELVANLKEVFRGRLQRLDWMSAATREQALANFERFTSKIGHPEKFRDYSSVEIRPNDYLGNVLRSERFEVQRKLRRVGQPVDRTEWHMTPQTVNAYFNASQNEIVFPAGILQPPFFDLALDDAVNYGAIGAVIGHEITHGYDDKGRKYDADGNLNDWWAEPDAKAFDAQAQKVIAQYNAYEILPGVHVNGELTLGENIADLGGVSIAYEALERALAKDPGKRKTIGGLTPEQRFFLSFSQVWRTNVRDAEARRLVSVDPHSPGKFRAIGAHVNLQEFFDAFNITASAPMWRPLDLRAKIW